MKTVILSVAGLLAAVIFAAMSNIADQVRPPPPPPVLEFTGTPIIGPMANGKVTIIYQLRRNESCKTTIHVRWYNLDLHAYDADYALTFEATRAKVTDQFEPFPLSIPHPNEPGNWAYDPLIDPGPNCASQKQIQPPLAVVKVTADR